MSRKEPLLGALKACILNIQADKDLITDRNPHLASLCDVLEVILRKGIRQPVLGLRRRDYWHWMEQLPQQDLCGRLTQLSLALEKTITCKKILTAQGRGRHYLRQALNQNILAITVQHLLHTPRLLEWYDPESSILANECFAEPFLSLLLVLSQTKLTLDLQNSSFLDESWLLPVCEMYDTVPCRELGMVLRYTDRRIFVREVIAGSQAEADECVQAGDIIDGINGISLRNAQRGEAQTVLQKLRGKPLSFHMIRWKWHDGAVYRPMLPHLQQMQREIPNFRLHDDNKSNEVTQEDGLRDDRLLYSLRYLGQMNIGMYGGKEVLDEGIEKVLKQNLAPQEVLFDVKETEVISIKNNSTEILFHHHYPEISSVGHWLNRRTLFAYCVAVSPETPRTTSFDCLVYESSSVTEANEIITRIVLPNGTGTSLNPKPDNAQASESAVPCALLDDCSSGSSSDLGRKRRTGRSQTSVNLPDVRSNGKSPESRQLEPNGFPLPALALRRHQTTWTPSSSSGTSLSSRTSADPSSDSKSTPTAGFRHTEWFV